MSDKFDFIIAAPDGKEIGYICNDIDVDVGETNDFELTVEIAEWDIQMYGYGNLIYIPGTEYGGVIEDCEVKTRNDSVILRGHTWRGLLMKKIIEPPKDSDNLILNGELNAVIRELVGNRFGNLFAVDDISTEVELKNWIVDRYATLYDTIQKFLEKKGYRLKIQYLQGEELEAGKVHLGAVPIIDYSQELEYSQDANLDFEIRDCRTGINHLICGGSGEGVERTIIHLYVQKDGSIGETPYYTGLAERVEFYDCSSNQAVEKLEEDGIKRLKELQNYKKFGMYIDNIDLEIGDIVGGREYVTGTELKKPVVNKIFRKSNGKVSIEYKLKGEE